jgi:AraC-like DNA-binding protein
VSGTPSRYVEQPPPAALARFVECVWRRDLNEDDGRDRGVVLPDGRVDLVWVPGGEPLVAGPQTRFVPRPLAPPFTAVGVRFHPGVAPPLLGLPAGELVDLHVPLAQVDTARAAQLRRRLPALAGPDDAPRVIASALPRWIAAAEPDPALRAAVRLLDLAGATVDEVARRVGFSERELRRRFGGAVGYGPKMLQRVLRFQRMLAALGQGDRRTGDLAGIAASSGYSDQAHMTRETRDLAGITPSRLAQSI